MKLASFRLSPPERARLGVAIELSDGRRYLGDPTSIASAARQVGVDLVTGPSPGEDMRALLGRGPEGLDGCKRAHEYLWRAVDSIGAEGLMSLGLLHDEGSVEFLPVVPRPGKMICAGLNYDTHVDEAAKIGIARGATSKGFVKFSTSLIGHRAGIEYPQETSQLDYEGELAIVIGSRATRVSPEEAWDAIIGYTIFNDVTSRDVQAEEMKAGMLLLGKNPMRSSPLGPYLVTADEVADPHALNLELRVNGEVRQSCSTSELIFDCPELVSYWSAAGLEPGDVIATGTPDGVGLFLDPPEENLLGPGDIVEVSVSCLGTLENEVVRDPAG